MTKRLKSKTLKYVSFNNYKFLVFILIFAALGGYVIFRSFAAGVMTISAANLYIDTNGGSCTRSSTSIAYNSVTACASMQAALSSAAAGDSIVVKCGSYPAQTLSSGGKTSAVTFQAETYDVPTDFRGAYTMISCVHVTSLDINVDKIHIAGLEATPTPWMTRPDNITLEYQDVMNCSGNPCNAAAIGGAPGHLGICQTPTCPTATSYTDVRIDYWKGPIAQVQTSGTTIDHGNFGGFDSCHLGSLNGYSYVVANSNGLSQGTSAALGGDVMHFPWQSGSVALSNVTVAHTVFHDNLHGFGNADPITCTGFNSATGSHSDQIQGNGCLNDCVIEKNGFWNGGDKPIQWTVFNGITTFTNAFVQNNFFDGQYNTSSSFGQTQNDCSGMFWQNNLGQGPNVTGCTTAAVTVRNDIEPFKHTTCGPAGTLINFSHQIYDPTSTVTCGSGANASKKCTPQWVNTPTYNAGQTALRFAAPDLTLSANDTCAQNFSDSGFPADDWLDTPRPQGTGADAGPDEFGSGGGGPPPSTPPTVSLLANPTTIASGASSTLSWSSSNATSCSASGAWSGAKATAGNQAVSPSATSTYNLACSGAGGNTTKSTTITVNPASTPPPASPPTIKGDLNADNHVNVFDLSILLTHYAGSGTGDIDGNGTVNVIDLSILLTNYGQ